MTQTPMDIETLVAPRSRCVAGYNDPNTHGHSNKSGAWKSLCSGGHFTTAEKLGGNVLVLLDAMVSGCGVLFGGGGGHSLALAKLHVPKIGAK